MCPTVVRPTALVRGGGTLGPVMPGRTDSLSAEFRLGPLCPCRLCGQYNLCQVYLWRCLVRGRRLNTRGARIVNTLMPNILAASTTGVVYVVWVVRQRACRRLSVMQYVWWSPTHTHRMITMTTYTFCRTSAASEMDVAQINGNCIFVLIVGTSIWKTIIVTVNK